MLGQDFFSIYHFQIFYHLLLPFPDQNKVNCRSTATRLIRYGLWFLFHKEGIGYHQIHGYSKFQYHLPFCVSGSVSIPTMYSSVTTWVASYMSIQITTNKNALFCTYFHQ